MKITEKILARLSLDNLGEQNKLALSISDLGARIVSLKSNDRELVLGFDTAEEYIEKIRISVLLSVAPQGIENGHFSQWKNLPISHRSKTGHNLHGGAPGFELKWSYVILNGENEASVILLQVPTENMVFQVQWMWKSAIL